MKDRILYGKLYWHNAFTNYPLDIDSLGAGGSKKHLVFAGTQHKLGNLMTPSELWDLIDSIGNYEYMAGSQRSEAIPMWEEECKRIDHENEKINHYFIYEWVRTTAFKTHVRSDQIVI